MFGRRSSDKDVEQFFSGVIPEDEELARLVPLADALRRAGGHIPPEAEVARIAAAAALVARIASEDVPTAARLATGTRTSRPMRLSLKFVGMVVLIAALLSTTGVAFAANSAVPGDALYGFDRALERIGLGAGGLHERLTEASTLADRGAVEAGLAHATEAIAKARDLDEGASETYGALLVAANAVTTAGEGELSKCGSRWRRCSVGWRPPIPPAASSAKAHRNSRAAFRSRPREMKVALPTPPPAVHRVTMPTARPVPRRTAEPGPIQAASPLPPPTVGPATARAVSPVHTKRNDHDHHRRPLHSSHQHPAQQQLDSPGRERLKRSDARHEEGGKTLELQPAPVSDRPVDGKGTSDDGIHVDGAEQPAIPAVVAIVPHHEDLPLEDRSLRILSPEVLLVQVGLDYRRSIDEQIGHRGWPPCHQRPPLYA